MTRLVDLDDRRHTYIGDMGDYEVYSIDPEATVNIADIESKKRGRWIDRNTPLHLYSPWHRYKCSVCGGFSDEFEYCPNCGARMDLK